MNKRIAELADISQQITEPFLAELLHHALQWTFALFSNRLS